MTSKMTNTNSEQSKYYQTFSSKRGQFNITEYHA